MIFTSHQSPGIVKKSVTARVLDSNSEERLLLEQVVEAFQASTGLQLELLPSPSAGDDGTAWRLALTAEQGVPPRLYRPLVRSIDRPEALGAVKAELQESREPAVLVAPKLTGVLAQHGRSMDLPFLDGQGNAYLKDQGLLIMVMGQRHAAAQKASKARRVTGRAGTATGLQLVFALLSDPALAKATSQVLHQVAGVALGSVPAVLGDLEQRGQLVRLGWGKGWQVRDWRQLLDEWAKQYPLVLRPKLRSFRFRSPGQGHWWQEVDPQAYGGQWGGEVAAAQLGTVLRPEQSLLYLQPEAMRLGLAQLIKTQGLRSDPEGDVEVVEAFWRNESLGLSGPCVPVPLVIADLQASLDARNIDAAVELRENWIRDVAA